MRLPVNDLAKQNWPWVEVIPKWPETMPDGQPWPKISVVTPSYNQGQFLEETIRSVLLQGYPNLEYIIIDGGSSDNSVEIIRKYEPWLTYWESCKDRGQSHAINKGFTRVSGNIVAWLNSDDVYAPEVLLKVATKLGNRDQTLLVGASVLTDTPDKLRGKLDMRRPTWQEMAYDARSFPQPSVFWTYDLWAKVRGLNEALYFAMDYDLWLRMRIHAPREIFEDSIFSYARCHSRQKGNLAESEGTQDRFTFQRAFVAYHAARERGEHPFRWLYIIWQRRIKKAVYEESFSHLKGSAYHWCATRIVFNDVFRGKYK
jgi:glycosyltransferase involved in cell wall biosynthesis